jgi:hypothetical protein
VERGSIRPCVYPGCRDTDGNPRLTTDVICGPSRGHYRTTLTRLGWDYVTIHTTMPKPATFGPRTRTSSARTYGHPAEWASDTLAEIADALNTAEAAVRGWLGHAPAVHSGHAEPRRVALALHYLDVWFDELCIHPNAGTAADQITDLHRRIYSALSGGPHRTRLPVPCPECDLVLLARVLDAGVDRIECRNPECGVRITPDHYGLWTQIVLDRALGSEEQGACA